MGPVCHIPCDSCDASFTGETVRLLNYLEHRRPSSTTSEVSRHTHIDMYKVKILAVEPR